MPDSDFGDRLRVAMEAKGLSAASLGSLCGVSPRMVQRLLAGERQPSFLFAQLFAKALGISLDDLADPGLALPEGVTLRKRGWQKGRPRKAVEEGEGKRSGAKSKAKDKGKDKDEEKS